MGRSKYSFAPVVRGLYIPDSASETPDGTLAKATNVDLTLAGSVRQRYGTQASTTTHSSMQYACVHQATTPQAILLEADGSGRIYTAGGTSFVAGAAISGGPTSASGSAQMLRSPQTTSAPDTYIASAGNTLYRWNGTSMSAVANSPKCRFVTYAGFSDRLICWGFTAGANGPAGDTAVDNSTMWASDAASPEAYTAGTRTELGPGVGGDATGACTFNNQAFLFKEDRFFVVYNEVASGGAVEFYFNERTGAGMVTQGAYAVSPIGVFFQGADGIYLTDGGPARKVSGNIGGLFSGDLPAWCDYTRLRPSPDTPAPKMAVTSDTLYAAVGRVENDETLTDVILAYNWKMDAWTYYDYPAKAIGAMSWPEIPQPLLYAVASNGSSAEMVTNGGFEVDTTGWSATNATFLTAGGTVTRVTTSTRTGDGAGFVDTPGLGRGAAYTISGTFLAGQTYTANVYLRGVNGAEKVSGIFGSETGTDYATAAYSTQWAALGLTYQLYSISWTPTADRTNARFVLKSAEAAVFNASWLVDDLSIQNPDGAALYFSPAAFHPLLRTDLENWMPVDFQLQWLDPPNDDNDSDVGLDAASILRFDAWGRGIFDVGTVTDYGTDPAATQTLDFGDMSANSAANDVWGDGSDITDVWGDGTIAADVWGAGYGSELELMRLEQPVHKQVFNLNGRGNYLGVRLTKTAASSFCFLDRPKMTLIGR